MKKPLLLFAMLLFATASFSQGDLFIDPTSQEGSDYEGFRMYTMRNGVPYTQWDNGLPAVHTSVDLVCGQGQVVLDTANLVRDLNSTYYITPAIIVIQLKDANGVVVSTQTIDQYHIIDSSQRNYLDPLRANDTICWQGLVDNNLVPNVGTEELPRMSEGYGNLFHGANEEIPAYLPLTAALPSGNYEYCVTADFSYFLNESTSPTEIPDFWCVMYSHDATTGAFTRIPYPVPPTQVIDVAVSYTAGNPVEVIIEGDPNQNYYVERWTKRGGGANKGGRHRALNPTQVFGNSFIDHNIEEDAASFWGTRNKVYFYYKAKPMGSDLELKKSNVSGL